MRLWNLCRQREAGFHALAASAMPRYRHQGRPGLAGLLWKDRAAAAGSGVVRRRSGCLGLDPVFFQDGETALSVSYPNQGIYHLAYKPLSFTG